MSGQAPLSPAITLTDWQYPWGDSPVDDRGVRLWALLETEAGWRRTSDALNPEGRAGHRFLWLRHQLPSERWPNPVLFVPPIVLAHEIYVDGEPILKVGEAGRRYGGKANVLSRHFVPLPSDYGGKTLAARIYSVLDRFIGSIEPFRVGSHGDVARNVLLNDLDSVVLGIVPVSLGLFSLVLFTFGRRRAVRISRTDDRVRAVAHHAPDLAVPPGIRDGLRCCSLAPLLDQRTLVS